MKTTSILSGTVLALALAACGDDDKESSADGSGGMTASGGASSGGRAASGGARTGGTTGSGGMTASGGMTGSGGMTASGGTTATGGAPGTGGMAGDAGPPPAPPTLGSQIDRMGRPAINTALNETFNADTTAKNTAKDAYNAADKASWATYKPAFEAGLAILDSLDTVCGNQLLAGATASAGRYGALADVLVDDQLYLHSGRGTCDAYLGLEAEIVGALTAPAGGCGGRTPAYDVIERSYSVLAAGALTGIDDTIATDADQGQTASFPFLAPPTP